MESIDQILQEYDHDYFDNGKNTTNVKDKEIEQ